jgi:hypothetical protein
MYHITPYTYRQAKRLGVRVEPSKNPAKKIDVWNGTKRISIGARGMGDYPTYRQTRGIRFAKQRRRLYKMRHAKDRTKRGTPGYYADQLLW